MKIDADRLKTKKEDDHEKWLKEVNKQMHKISKEYRKDTGSKINVNSHVQDLKYNEDFEMDAQNLGFIGKKRLNEKE